MTGIKSFSSPFFIPSASHHTRSSLRFYWYYFWWICVTQFHGSRSHARFSTHKFRIIFFVRAWPPSPSAPPPQSRSDQIEMIKVFKRVKNNSCGNNEIYCLVPKRLSNRCKQSSKKLEVKKPWLTWLCFIGFSGGFIFVLHTYLNLF